MNIRRNATLIAALLMSLSLLLFVPGSLRSALTWKELYIEAGGYKEQNLLMPLGFYSLAIEIIGFVVLWTGFRRKERWAWFVMLVILMFFVFPVNVLWLLLSMRTPSFEWSYWFEGIRQGSWPSISMATGLVAFFVMLGALLLPVKSFFWRSANPGNRGT
jgi:hypothetical protein